MDDYLKNLKYLGLISRLKRLSDKTIISGRKLYQYIDMDIEPNWFLVFMILIENQVTSVTDISRKLDFSHPSVIAIVKKMEKAGYLDISPSQEDKRKQEIRLSKKADLQLPEIQKIWDASEKGVRSIFENDLFINELEKVEKALEEESFFERVLKHLDTKSPTE